MSEQFQSEEAEKLKGRVLVLVRSRVLVQEEEEELLGLLPK